MVVHDFHVERNPFDPASPRPWLVENSLGCVVARYATRPEAVTNERFRNEQATADISGVV